MTNLISGKEALIALANGENIQQNINGEWSDIRRDISWRSILGDNYSLRLKPHTITINEIEVPAPFEPKEGDYVMDIEKLKNRCGYDGKPQQFKYGFDLACRELAKAQAVPEGFVVVPKEPTDAMLIAADNCVINGKVTANNIYKAMLEAARGQKK